MNYHERPWPTGSATLRVTDRDGRVETASAQYAWWCQDISDDIDEAIEELLSYPTRENGDS